MFLEALNLVGEGDAEVEQADFNVPSWGDVDIPVQMSDYDILVAWYVSGATATSDTCTATHIELSMLPTYAVLHGHIGCPLVFETLPYWNNDTIRSATAKRIGRALNGTWHYIAIKLNS